MKNLLITLIFSVLFSFLTFSSIAETSNTITISAKDWAQYGPLAEKLLKSQQDTIDLQLREQGINNKNIIPTGKHLVIHTNLGTIDHVFLEGQNLTVASVIAFIAKNLVSEIDAAETDTTTFNSVQNSQVMAPYKFGEGTTGACPMIESRSSGIVSIPVKPDSTNWLVRIFKGILVGILIVAYLLARKKQIAFNMEAEVKRLEEREVSLQKSLEWQRNENRRNLHDMFGKLEEIVKLKPKLISLIITPLLFFSGQASAKGGGRNIDIWNTDLQIEFDPYIFAIVFVAAIFLAALIAICYKKNKEGEKNNVKTENPPGDLSSA